MGETLILSSWFLTMLNYSLSTLSTRVMMMQRFNDIDVYIEDKINHNMHKKILNACLPDGLKFSSVFPCGNREGVIAEALNHVGNKSRLKIFVCDGDLYLQCGEKLDIPKNVLVLNRYCTENFIVNLDSILMMAFECEPDKTLEELKEEMNIDSWYRQQIEILSELFLWYAISFDLNLDVKTCCINVLAFFDDANAQVDTKKINAKIGEIKEYITRKNISSDIVEGSMRKIYENRNSIPDISMAISGKTYLLPMLSRFLKIKTNFRDEKGFLMRLCNKYEPGEGEFLKIWIKDFMNSFYNLEDQSEIVS